MLCKFDESFVNDTYSDNLFKIFKLNASYQKLPLESIVGVTYSGSTVFVQINNNNFTGSSETLYLSKKAAQILHIKPGESVPCDLQVPKLKKHSTKSQWIMFGIFSVIAIALIFQNVLLLT